MENQKIEVGDVVQLNAYMGSQLNFMTVEKVNEEMAFCVWWDNLGKVLQRDFRIDSLVLIRKKGDKV